MTTTQYKVWLEIEEVDESRDHYQTVDTPGGEIATFQDYQQACAFVAFANHLLDSVYVRPLAALGMAPSEREALVDVLQYLHKDEKRDYESCETEEERQNHIWRRCLMLRELLERIA